MPNRRGCLFVVPFGPLEPGYAPDGLTEADIEMLLAQTGPAAGVGVDLPDRSDDELVCDSEPAPPGWVVHQLSVRLTAAGEAA